MIVSIQGFSVVQSQKPIVKGANRSAIPVIQIVANTKPEKFINVGVDRVPVKILKIIDVMEISFVV